MNGCTRFSFTADLLHAAAHNHSKTRVTFFLLLLLLLFSPYTKVVGVTSHHTTTQTGLLERNAQRCMLRPCVVYGHCVYMVAAAAATGDENGVPLCSLPPPSYGATFLDGTGTDQIMAAISD